MLSRTALGALSGAFAGWFLLLALPAQRPALDEDEYVYVVFGHVPCWMVLSACVTFGLLTLAKAGNRGAAMVTGVGVWLLLGIAGAVAGVFREDSAWLPLGAFALPTVSLALAAALTTPRQAVR